MWKAEWHLFSFFFKETRQLGDTRLPLSQWSCRRKKKFKRKVNINEKKKKNWFLVKSCSGVCWSPIYSPQKTNLNESYANRSFEFPFTIMRASSCQTCRFPPIASGVAVFIDIIRLWFPSFFSGFSFLFFVFLLLELVSIVYLVSSLYSVYAHHVQ